MASSVSDDWGALWRGCAAARDAEVAAQHKTDALQSDAAHRDAEGKHEKAKLHLALDTLTKTLHASQAEAAGGDRGWLRPSLGHSGRRVLAFRIATKT